MRNLIYYAWTVVCHDRRGNVAMLVGSRDNAIDLACRLFRNGKVIMSVTNPHELGEKAISVEEINTLCADCPERNRPLS